MTLSPASGGSQYVQEFRWKQTAPTTQSALMRQVVWQGMHCPPLQRCRSPQSESPVQTFGAPSGVASRRSASPSRRPASPLESAPTSARGRVSIGPSAGPRSGRPASVPTDTLLLASTAIHRPPGTGRREVLPQAANPRIKTIRACANLSELGPIH